MTKAVEPSCGKVGGWYLLRFAGSIAGRMSFVAGTTLKEQLKRLEQRKDLIRVHVGHGDMCGFEWKKPLGLCAFSECVLLFILRANCSDICNQHSISLASTIA